MTITQYEIFSDQLDHYEETVEKIFQSPLPDSIKIGENVLRQGFKKPKHNYLICFTNRSGSTLLAMTLAKTDAMGIPGEMFNPEPLTQARQKQGIASFNEFLDFKIQTTTKQGAFGAKVGIHQLAYLAKHGYIKDKLSSPRFIYITRKDIVMQAVSLYIAWQTGAWSSNARTTAAKPEYSMEGIAQQLKSILTIQAQFEAFFAASNPTTEAYLRSHRSRLGRQSTSCMPICWHSAPKKAAICLSWAKETTHRT